MRKKVLNIPADILTDSDGRYVLDSYSKVLNYILCTSEQDTINLSNCVLIPSSDHFSFDFWELFRHAESKGQNLDIGISKNNDKTGAQLVVSKRVVCNNSIIKKSSFSNVSFEKFVTFGKSVLENIHFSHSIFSTGVSITESVITGYVAFNGIKARSSYLHDISYVGSYFDFTFSKIESISILSSTFQYSEDNKKEAIEKPGIIHHDLNFAHSLLGEVQINRGNSELFISFLDSHITGSLHVYDCTLEKGLILEGCIISGVQSTIINTTNHKNNGNAILGISGIKIQSELTIIGISCESIDARDCVIEKSGRLSIFQTITNYIDFERASFYGEVNINHLNPSSSKNANSLCKINMECAINLGNLNISLDNVKVLNYDTAKILRLAAQKLNNSIEIPALRATEHKLFLKENKLRFSFTSIADHILLWLNKMSNDFGTNWILGCFFCIVVSMIFKGLIGLSLGEYILCLDPSNWVLFSKQFWVGTFEFLWLPNLDSFKDIVSNERCTPLTMIAYIAGKSLIAYGIFQTVVAFRKYSSK